jgi:hypothetical protein
MGRCSSFQGVSREATATKCSRAARLPIPSRLHDLSDHAARNEKTGPLVVSTVGSLAKAASSCANHHTARHEDARGTSEPVVARSILLADVHCHAVAEDRDDFLFLKGATAPSFDPGPRVLWENRRDPSLAAIALACLLLGEVLDECLRGPSEIHDTFAQERDHIPCATCCLHLRAKPGVGVPRRLANCELAPLGRK